MTLYTDITDNYIDESAGEVYDPDYLCRVEYGGEACPLSTYANLKKIVKLLSLPGFEPKTSG